MGQSRKRVGRNGDVRYNAYYEDARGHRRSARTFTNLKAANKAWQQAEAKVAEGQFIGSCALSAWLPQADRDADVARARVLHAHP